VHGERILSITIDSSSDQPVYRQVYAGVRQCILTGAVAPGARLPSTRALSADLGVSRNTVVMAYEQLRSEGYTVGRGGSDTRVAEQVPDRLMHAPAAPTRSAGPRPHARPAATAIAMRDVWRAANPRLDMVPRAFRAGTPATDLFPYALWGRLLSRRWNRVSARDLGYANPQGYLPLREAIVSYIAAARGVQCSAEQVFVVGGAQGALSVAARLVLDPGSAAWMEDPGYHGSRGAILGAGGRAVPVPVDEEGMRVDHGIAHAADARAAFVTPARQMPLGVPMSIARRSALLAWASASHSWIVEDDYDSELRFASRPLPSLQGEDTTGAVLYVGTFSKVLFPALRLGYVVVPEALVDTAVAVRHLHDAFSPTLEQMVLSDFIEGGHFERHVRRVRQVYLERQQGLRDAVRRHLRGALDIPSGEAGLFVTAWLHGISDEAASRAASAHGVDLMPLSRMAQLPVAPGVVLGYAGLNITDIADGVQRLARALAPLIPRR